MAKTKSEKIASIGEQIAQLENQRKQLIQAQKAQERKDRTRRLIERGAILESLIDGAATLTNDQIKALLEKAISTQNSRRQLETTTAQGGGTGASQSANNTGETTV
jgi:multidrug resistance efflux pump